MEETGHVYQPNRTFRNEIDEMVTELCACIKSVPVSESPQVYVFFVIPVSSTFPPVRMSTNSLGVCSAKDKKSAAIQLLHGQSRIIKRK